MADVSDVMNALASLFTTALYPNGTGNPVSPVISASARIYAGWPNSEQQDSDLVSGIVNVSIFPTNVERKTTRYIDPYSAINTITGGHQTLTRQSRTTMREFRVFIAANTPTLRDATGAAIDQAVEALDHHLPFTDGSIGFITSSKTVLDDMPQKASLFARYNFYQVEYGTFQSVTATAVTEMGITVTGGFDPTSIIKEITIT